MASVDTARPGRGGGEAIVEHSCPPRAGRATRPQPLSICFNEVPSYSPSDTCGSSSSSFLSSSVSSRKGKAGTGRRSSSCPALPHSEATSTQVPSSQLSSSGVSSLNPSPPKTGGAATSRTCTWGKVNRLRSSSSLPRLSASPTPSSVPACCRPQTPPRRHPGRSTVAAAPQWTLEQAELREFAVSEAGSLSPHKSFELCLSAASFLRGGGELLSQRLPSCCVSPRTPLGAGKGFDRGARQLLCVQAILSCDKLPRPSETTGVGTGWEDRRARVVWETFCSRAGRRRSHRNAGGNESLVFRSFESPQQACAAAGEEAAEEGKSAQTVGRHPAKENHFPDTRGRQRSSGEPAVDFAPGPDCTSCGALCEAGSEEKARGGRADQQHTEEEEEATTSCGLTEPFSSGKSPKQQGCSSQGTAVGWDGLGEEACGNEELQQKEARCGPTLRELCSGVAYPLCCGHVSRHTGLRVIGRIENKGCWLEKNLRCEACSSLGSRCYCRSISLDAPLEFLAVSRRSFLFSSFFSRSPLTTEREGRKKTHQLHPPSSSAFSPETGVRRRSTPEGLTRDVSKRRQSSVLSCLSNSGGGESSRLHGLVGQWRVGNIPLLRLYLAGKNSSGRAESVGGTSFLVLTSLPLPRTVPSPVTNGESFLSSPFVFSISRDAEEQHSASSRNKRKLPPFFRLSTKNGGGGGSEEGATDAAEESMGESAKAGDDVGDPSFLENDYSEEEPTTGTCVNLFFRGVYECEFQDWKKTLEFEESIASGSRARDILPMARSEEQQGRKRRLDGGPDCEAGGHDEASFLAVSLSPPSPRSRSAESTSSRRRRRSPPLLRHCSLANRRRRRKGELQGDASLPALATYEREDTHGELMRQEEDGSDHHRRLSAHWQGECKSIDRADAALEEGNPGDILDAPGADSRLFDDSERGPCLPRSLSPCAVAGDTDQPLDDSDKGGGEGREALPRQQQGQQGRAVLEKEEHESSVCCRASKDGSDSGPEVGRESGRRTDSKCGEGREWSKSEEKRRKSLAEQNTRQRQDIREEVPKENKKSLFSGDLRRLIKRFLRERLPPPAPTTDVSFAGRHLVDIR